MTINFIGEPEDIAVWVPKIRRLLENSGDITEHPFMAVIKHYPRAVND